MKAPLLITTTAAALLAITSFATAQNENTRQPNPEMNAPAGQQPDSSKGLGTGSSAGDTAQPTRPDNTTTGEGRVLTPPAAGQPTTTENGVPVVRPSETKKSRPGDSAN